MSIDKRRLWQLKYNDCVMFCPRVRCWCSTLETTLTHQAED